MKYEDYQCAHLGIVKTMAYRCLRCWYSWLPKDVEITKGDELLHRKPPAVCARCKSRLWKSAPKRTSKVQPMAASIARVRALLRKGKGIEAANLLSHTHPKEIDRILKKVEKEMSPKDFELLKRFIWMRVPKPRQQDLQTFKPPK